MTLAFASGALRVLPFKRAIQLGAVALRDCPAAPAPADDCVWAVEAAARRLPWRVVCIQKGIAVQRMLRRRGIDAILRYGIANGRVADRLEAHVWVTVDGEAVIGGAEARAFAPVAAFP